MSYEYQKPYGSPPCWGLKYQDGERECVQCSFKETCRPTVMAKLIPTSSLTQQPPALPQLPSFPRSLPAAPPPPPVPAYQSSLFRPQTAPAPQTQPYSIPTQAPPPQQNPYNTAQYPLDHNNPNPWAAMFRPGSQAPPHYFIQHPGESTRERLLKNILLRLLEAVLQELAHFFRHWMWPPNSDRKNNHKE